MSLVLLVAISVALGLVVGYGLGTERAARARRSSEAMRHVSRRY